MTLVPTADAQTDLGEEMRKLQELAEAPVTPSTFPSGASAVSPTIAGTPGPALSGVLANTEGLSAFEQIIKLREVRHDGILAKQRKILEKILLRLDWIQPTDCHAFCAGTGGHARGGETRR